MKISIFNDQKTTIYKSRYLPVSGYCPPCDASKQNLAERMDAAKLKT
jgi:hypothetical protein